MLKTNKKTISVILNQDLSNYIALYTLSEGCARTKVVESILNSWHKNISKIKSEEILIKKLKECLHSEWIAERTKIGKEGFPTFIENSKQYLSSKGISTSQINQIINIEP